MLKLVRRRKSPFWIVRGSIKGRRIEESTGTRDRKLAEEYRAKREAEIHREWVYGRAATASFADAAVSYLQSGGEKRYILPVIEYFRETPLSRIDLAAIDAGGRHVYPNASPSTLNRHWYTPVSATLHHAAKRGMCAMPIIERPRQPRGRVRWITADEAERLIEPAVSTFDRWLSSCSTPGLALARHCGSTGARSISIAVTSRSLTPRVERIGAFRYPPA